jgi:hypothetical protein
VKLKKRSERSEWALTLASPQRDHAIIPLLMITSTKEIRIFKSEIRMWNNECKMMNVEY